MGSLIKKRYSGNNTTLKASFDEIQKRKDEFQRITVLNELLPAKKVDSNTYSADLTKTKKKYMFLTRTNFIASKGECKERRLKGIFPQTDDMDLVEDSTLEGPSFEWGETIFRLSEDKIFVNTDGSFRIEKAKIDYLRYPVKIDIAGYTHFDSTRSSNVSCELPDFMHDDIVDEAIFIYSVSPADVRAILFKLANNE